MNHPYRASVATPAYEVPNFRAPSKAPNFVGLAVYAAVLAMTYLLAYVAPDALAPAALFTIRRVTFGLIVLTAMIVPAAREFLAVRRARRLAGWK
jgi:hypothetical protein